ncbi:MAG: hypothetical protein SF053_08115 [Bacteroidia bacterium]|nr:hypothetical protein [Bacteroidia bacterium]
MKVWYLVSLLSQSELEEITRLLPVLYPGRNNQPSYEQRLFDLIKDGKTPEEASAAFYPASRFNPSPFRKLSSTLSATLENYLINQHLRKQEVSRLYLLTQALNARNSPEVFMHTFNRLVQKLQEAPIRDHTYHQQMYAALTELDIYQYKGLRTKEKSASGDPGYHLLAKQLYERVLEAGRQLTLQPVNVPGLTEELRWLEACCPPAETGLQALIALLRHSLFPKDIPIMELLTQLQRCWPQYSPATRASVYNWALNNCRRYKAQYQDGAAATAWFRFGSQPNQAMIHGRLSDVAYKELIFDAIKRGELDEAETLLTELSLYLQPETATVVYDFCQVICQFERASRAGDQPLLKKIYARYNQEMPDNDLWALELRVCTWKAAFQLRPGAADLTGQLNGIKTWVRRQTSFSPSQRTHIDHRLQKFRELLAFSRRSIPHELAVWVTSLEAEPAGLRIDTSWLIRMAGQLPS